MNKKTNIFFKIKCVALSLMAISISSLQADLGDGFLLSRETNKMSAFVDALAEKKYQHSLLRSSWKKDYPKEYRSCSDQYTKLYEDNILKINLVFGYFDIIDRKGKTYTLDRKKFSEVYETLVRKCPTYTRENGKSFYRGKVCEFKDISSGRSPFKKTLQKKFKMRRDGKSVIFKMNINLVHSSYSGSDRGNITSTGLPNRKQLKASLQAEDSFFGGISGQGYDGRKVDNCEICIYLGHARDGGGPDFYPVPFNFRKEDQHPNYDLYQKYRPGYKKLLMSLRQASKKPTLISLFGCYTERHFWKKKICPDKACNQKMSLKNFKDETAFILTDKLSWPQNNAGTLGSLLDTLVNFKCKSALQENFDSLRDITGKKGEDYGEDYGIFGNFL